MNRRGPTLKLLQPPISRRTICYARCIRFASVIHWACAMTAMLDRLKCGSYAPGILDRSVIALTSRMPLNWLGLRLAILLRRISTMRLEHPAGALDVMRWGMRLRLHPIDNGCEKNSAVHTTDVRDNRACGVVRGNFRVREQRHKFVFVDIGANVGLFSIFVAATAKLNVQNSRCRT